MPRLYADYERRHAELTAVRDRELMRPLEGARIDVDIVGVITGRQPMPAFEGLRRDHGPKRDRNPAT